MKKEIPLVPDTVLGQTADTLFVTEVNITGLERAKVWYQIARKDPEADDGYFIICKGDFEIKKEIYDQWGKDDSFVVDKILEVIKLRKVVQ